MSRHTIALLLILGLVAVSFVEAGQKRRNNDKDDDKNGDDDKDDDKEEEKCYDKDCPPGMKCYQDECRLYCPKSGMCDYGAKTCDVHHGQEYCPGDKPKKPKIPKCGGMEWCKVCEEVKVITTKRRPYPSAQRPSIVQPPIKYVEKVVSCKQCMYPAYRQLYKKSTWGGGDNAYICAGGDNGGY